jgi:hypothetical protein
MPTMMWFFYKVKTSTLRDRGNKRTFQESKTQIKRNQGITSGILSYQNGRTPAYLVFQAFAILFHKRNGNTFMGKVRVSWLICGLFHNCIKLIPFSFLDNCSLPNLHVCVNTSPWSATINDYGRHLAILTWKKQTDEKNEICVSLWCKTACDSPFRRLQKKSVWDRILLAISILQLPRKRIRSLCSRIETKYFPRTTASLGARWRH